MLKQLTPLESGKLRTGLLNAHHYLPWLRRLVAYFSTRRHRFHPRAFHIGFMMDVVTPLYEYVDFPLPIIIPSMSHTLICHPGLV
jgi:hypothetical protein